MPVLCNRVDADASDSDSDNDRDRENNNDGEQKKKHPADPMKINTGFLDGKKGIFDNKNNDQNKTRKMGKCY